MSSEFTYDVISARYDVIYVRLCNIYVRLVFTGGSMCNILFYCWILLKHIARGLRIHRLTTKCSSAFLYDFPLAFMHKGSM